MAKKKQSKHAASQADYLAKRKAEGWKRICVWVPPEQIDAFQKTVARIKKKWS